MKASPEAKKLVFLLDFINTANKRKQRGKLDEAGLNELSEMKKEFLKLKNQIKKS